MLYKMEYSTLYISCQAHFTFLQKKLPRNLSGEVFERLAGFRRPQAAKLNELHFRDGPENASRGASVPPGRAAGVQTLSQKRAKPFSARSFRGDHIVVHRLPAGQQGDLGVGALLLEDGQSLVGLLLADILAVEDADELGVLLAVRLGQPL